MGYSHTQAPMSSPADRTDNPVISFSLTCRCPEKPGFVAGNRTDCPSVTLSRSVFAQNEANCWEFGFSAPARASRYAGGAGRLRPEQPLHLYRWSSYPWYLLERSRRPVWLRVGRLLGEWGIPHRR